MAVSRVPGSLVDLYDSLLLDLDGVVYVGADPVEHAAEALNSAITLGCRLIYVTNNASRPPEVVAAQLSSMGLPAAATDVITSAQAGAGVLAARLVPGTEVLAVGGPGVPAALREAGLDPVDALSPAAEDRLSSVSAVLQGFGRETNWYALARATRAIRSGAIWIATNTDMTFPTESGIMPGNGTLVQAVATATGASPDVVGKPFPEIFSRAVERVGGQRPLVVGDRLDTDILGGRNAGIPSLLVLTGVTGAMELWRAEPPLRPTYLGADLRSLLEPPLAVTVSGNRAVCGSAVVSLEQGSLVVHGSNGRDFAIAAVWAAAHLIWAGDEFPENAAQIASDLSG